MKIAVPEHVRPQLEGRLPAGLEVAWHRNTATAEAAVQGAEAAWLDFTDAPALRRIVEAGQALRWVSTLIAGVGPYPLDLFAERDIAFTNGPGVNSNPVSEYALMGILALAKNLPAILDIQKSRKWSYRAPGLVELMGSRALIIGYGAIGQLIGKGLAGLGVEVTAVRRRPGGEPGVLGPDDWRPRLAEFDWVVLAAPATDETRRLIGTEELAAMKPGAFLINIARGTLVDQPALIAAVNEGRLGGAFLDVTDPEPAPPEDPVWSTPNIIMTCHMSGRAQTNMNQRAAAAFVENLARFQSGERLNNLVDLAAGY